MSPFRRQKRFSPLFYLVILFEFFERGAYYGMMSFLSVYFVEVLGFPKENVGVIKGVIQPLLYFLPILSGALADRFGYRKLLMVAFSLLGGGYFLTSQATSYGGVFAALVILGIGAGLFKPLISGTIAHITDKDTSSVAFGIYYWSINLGAFLFPLFLVPFLKAIDPTYVIIASGLCTATMLIPTALFFRDPVQKKRAESRSATSLIQTLSDAFEIVYSPLILLALTLRSSRTRSRLAFGLLAALFVIALVHFIHPRHETVRLAKIGIGRGPSTLVVEVRRNSLGQADFAFFRGGGASPARLILYKPDLLPRFLPELLDSLKTLDGFEKTTADTVRGWVLGSEKKITLVIRRAACDSLFRIDPSPEGFVLLVKDPRAVARNPEAMLRILHNHEVLAGITVDDCRAWMAALTRRPFFGLFVAVWIGLALCLAARIPGRDPGRSFPIESILLFLCGLGIWALPGIDPVGRILGSVFWLSLFALRRIDMQDPARFSEHARFLLLIFLYSGFWVLYFQMFDSVLWYVRAYVDAEPLNRAVQGLMSVFGLRTHWFFDVEHVTVINAGTIILLQIAVSKLVQNKRAMPTLIAGILMGTVGMLILAIDTSIWVFLAGIAIFSIGEMTAHPKFISYIGLTAPEDRKALYMGYLFLYGVFGSSIGGILGARMYVHFVDTLNRPRTLWLLFGGIGFFTIFTLMAYDRIVNRPGKAKKGSP